MSTPNPDASIFLEEDFFEDGLADLERRRQLERDGRVAADIMIELHDRGPLYMYVKARRAQAADALRSIINIDPKDAVAIAITQGVVQEYLRACEWIHGRIEAAERAEQIIREDYPEDEHGNPAEQADE